jgi:PKD repeat protein
MHDVSYAMGFTEAAGNFQQNNYGRGGRAGDFVRAEGQDGSGSATAAKNNANFSSPADGSSGRMQMYMWDSRPSSRLDVSAPISIIGTYQAGSAVFGPCAFNVQGQVVQALNGTSTLACTAITNAAAIAGKIAIIDRGSCNFTVKVKNAQNAGAIGVIIVDTVPNQIINMAGDDATITIPAISITREDGLKIKPVLNQGVQARLVGDSPTFCNDVDGSFDNGVVAHEYAHGISIRLTGGPLNASCLTVREQMGEGWSDFFGLVTTAKPEHTRTTRRGIGNYAVSFPVTGQGIRQYPYSTDMTVNPHTYDNIKTMTINGIQTDVHSVGSVWCAMLWEMYWNLVDKYGFSEDLIGGTKGNNIAIRLVTEGMKLQPCNPGFIDGRNAILRADTILYGGANSCLIWQAFAKRGLGRSATQGNANSLTDNNQAFDVPVCQTVVPPKAIFTPNNLEVCTGQSVNFTNSSTGDINTRTWRFGDGTSSSENNPAKTYNTPGTYVVTLIVAGPGGTDSTKTNVLVKQSPTVQISGNNSVCAGQEITLVASGAATYSWNTGQNSASITVTQTSTRTYTVTGTAENGCINTASKEVTSVPLPIVSAGANQVICQGQSIQLSASGATTYSWNTGANTAIINVSPANTTTYTVTGTTNGCSATAQVTVTVNPPPVANAGTGQTICAGTSATLNASGGNTYSWNTGATTPSITVSPATTTTYTVTAFVGTCSSQAQVTVTVLPKPTAGFNYSVSGFTANFTNTTAGGTSYTWNFGDGSNSTESSPSHTFPGPGTYTVTLVATNGDCSDQISQEITITSVGVNEQNWIRDFGIYPNPSRGMVTVSLQLEKELRVQLTVYNTMGQQLFSKDLGLMKQTVQNFDFSELPSGSYMMQLMMDDETGVKQMVIIR